MGISAASAGGIWLIVCFAGIKDRKEAFEC